jgi:hypothetical protein
MTFADILGQHGMVGTYFLNNTSPLGADQIASLAARGQVGPTPSPTLPCPGSPTMANSRRSRATKRISRGSPGSRSASWPGRSATRTRARSRRPRRRGSSARSAWEGCRLRSARSTPTMSHG